MLSQESVHTYISKCLGTGVHSILEIRELRDRSDGKVLDCRYKVDEVIERRVLKVYFKGFDEDYELGAAGVARKTQLASLELAAHPVRIPKVFGSYLSDDMACVLMERLEQTKWEAGTRVAASEILARLHNLPLSSLSDDLQRLIRDSRPNRDRIRLGVIGRSKRLDNEHPGWRAEYPELSQRASKIVEDAEPLSSMKTLVHGDYFSVNLIPTAEGLYVIDWDLLALGDPMWDLGFLVGADSGISEQEIEAVIRAYRRTRPIDEKVLSWHAECWSVFFELRKVIKKYSENPQIREAKN